MNSLY